VQYSEALGACGAGAGCGTRRGRGLDLLGLAKPQLSFCIVDDLLYKYRKANVRTRRSRFEHYIII
jgi:hypothetical protein